MDRDQLLWERIVKFVFGFFVFQFPKTVAVNSAIPALFAFGDSILDTGNNNNLLTFTKCNFPPYGRDFPGGKPTGRCCNGKTPTDLIATALGIKETVPAYLSGVLSSQDIVTGVCFASAGSGIDDFTANIQGVLSLPTQLGKFQEYRGKLTSIVGEKGAADIISKSLYLVSAGNNDIAITYSQILAPRLEPFPLYATGLIASISNFLKSLYAQGARSVWVLSTLPIGCLPGGRTEAGGPLRICATFANALAHTFNDQLSSLVNSIRSSLPNYDIRFIDVYTPLFNLINNPQPEGFVDVGEGCCGSGPFGSSGVCNLFSVCPNSSTYVFWDYAHPTERAYTFLVSSILKLNSTSFAFPPLYSSLSN